MIYFLALTKYFFLLGKCDLGIEEYSFSQSTLEQVFLEFAKEQDEDLKDDGKDGADQPLGSIVA